MSSTLHPKLKFVQNNKIVTVCREQALIINNISSFSDIEPKEVVETKFQALSLDKEDCKEKEVSISFYKDVIQVMKDGNTSGWGKIEIPTNNKNRIRVGFSPMTSKPAHKEEVVRPIHECPIVEVFFTLFNK